MDKIIRELLKKYGKQVIVFLWGIIGPIIMEELIDGVKELVKWIIKKVKSILSNRDEILTETILFNLEKAKQKATESVDIKEIDAWNTRAEVWEEVYGLITKDIQKTEQQIDNLEADSVERSESIFDKDNKQLEEKIIKKIEALPEPPS